MENTITTGVALRVKISETKHIWMVILDVVFLSTILIVSHIKGSVPNLDALTLVVFCLATFRMARTVSFNEIGEPLRNGLTITEKDSCGAGDNVHPKYKGGLLYVLGSAIACPICSGVWSALLLFTLFVLYEPLGRTLVYVLAFAGGSEMLHWGAEVLQWGGRAARVYSGAVSPDPKETEEEDNEL